MKKKSCLKDCTGVFLLVGFLIGLGSVVYLFSSTFEGKPEPHYGSLCENLSKKGGVVATVNLTKVAIQNGSISFTSHNGDLHVLTNIKCEIFPDTPSYRELLEQNGVEIYGR